MLPDALHRLRRAALSASELERDGLPLGLAARLAADEQASRACEAELRVLGLALERRDGETKGHTDRVTALAERMAHALCWSPSQTRALRSVPSHLREDTNAIEHTLDRTEIRNVQQQLL